VQVAENFWGIQRRATKKAVPFPNQDRRALPSEALLDADYVERGG